MSFFIWREAEAGIDQDEAMQLGFEKEMSLEDCYGLFRGRLPTSGLIQLRQTGGRVIADCMRAMRVWVISEKLRTVLLDCDATGWDTLPAEIKCTDGSLVEGYYCLVVQGESGELLHDRARQITIKQGPRELPFLEGCRIIEDDWDGMDVFAPRNQYFTIVVNRVAEAIRGVNVSGLALIDFDDHKKPDFSRVGQ